MVTFSKKEIAEKFNDIANKKINFITSQKGKFLFLDLNGELVF